MAMSSEQERIFKEVIMTYLKVF